MLYRLNSWSEQSPSGSKGKRDPLDSKKSLLSLETSDIFAKFKGQFFSNYRKRFQVFFFCVCVCINLFSQSGL